MRRAVTLALLLSLSIVASAEARSDARTIDFRGEAVSVPAGSANGAVLSFAAAPWSPRARAARRAAASIWASRCFAG